MRWLIALVILIILMTTGVSCGHRMFLSQQIKIDVCAIYDDGSPVQNSAVKVYKNGELYCENFTDSNGRFELPLPGRGTGTWQFEVSASGHKEDITINITDEKTSQGTKTAGILALAMIPMAFVSWKRRIRR